MKSKIGGGILFVVCAAVPGSACAMSDPRPCQVIGGENLPGGVGNAIAVCEVIERAIAAQAPNVRYRAEVQILSRSMLRATVVSEGRKLAEQKLAVMDRDLNASSIERFARALADEVAKAAKS